MSAKAVFLDRDNTILADPGYLSDPDDVKLLPGAALALQSLAQAGYKLVVATNQSGIARGLLTEETLGQIHAELRRQLAEQHVHLDAIYACPYHPEGTVEPYARESELRKPNPGMLLAAAEELDIDLERSWAVGDSPRDIEAGQRAGCRTILLRAHPDRHEDDPHEESARPDFVVRNIVDAAR
ncbi:MAG: D-glycero-alpha-D-manno-heptose-1,7-bisphosphate 7-phosphatase, partial [Planctomycetota bacterium]